jgi:ABC-2 type transport system permease protein
MMFLKECKKTMMSLTYLIFVAVLLLFGYTEIGTNLDRFDQIVPPQKGLESYGSKYEDNKELIVALFDEYISASYTAYPLGFYKNVKPGDEEQGEMAQILSELSGIPLDEFKLATLNNESGNPEILQISVDSRLVIERFYELMDQADKLIGGGSKYSDTYLIEFGKVQKTYEDAMLDYNLIVGEDKITGRWRGYFVII